MPAELGALGLVALATGFVHTLCGPDHYVPFLAMSRVGRWSLPRTVAVTLLCGIGHVGSSVLLGLVGIACGLALFRLETIEAVRGDLAGWLLIGFGLAYFAWGSVRAARNRPHTHAHSHPDGTVHVHEHVHVGEHLHAHAASPGCDANPYRSPNSQSPVGGGVGQGGSAKPAGMTPWVLFTIFLFGPCEPLVPLLMYPAAKANAWGVAWVTILFGLATLATMTGVVVLACLGLGSARFRPVHRFSHALAGLLILACGVAVKLGL